MLANLLKSLIVFTMTAGIHEQACFILLLHTNPAGKTVHWTDAIVTTPFFVLQPFALAFEAAVKSAWRGWKIKHHSNWRKSNTKHAEPAWLVFLERLVGFVWTWWWIGWSAGWFVRAVTRIGLFRRGGDQAPLPSFFGGVLWGKWRH